MKKFVILGGGAIGSIFAALLSKQYSVKLIARKPHVDLIKKKGLSLTGIIHETVALDAATRLDNIDNNTIILLTTKAQDSQKAVSDIKNLLKEDTVIICLQNGLGPEEVVRKIVPCKILRAVTKMSAEFSSPGKVNFTGDFPTYFDIRGREIALLFEKAGIKTELKDNINYEIWKKLIFNCVINGLGTVLHVKNNKLDSKFLDGVKGTIVEECLAVAKKERVKLDNAILDEVNNFIKVSNNLNSTLQDLQKQKGTEIEFLNGAVAKLGKKYGVPVPVNETIYSLVRFLETNGV